MIQLGKINTLTIARSTDFGLFLEDNDGNEVLLPNRYVAEEMKIGSEITVFVYNDSEDRPVATTEAPKAQVGDFAFLQVNAVNQTGAFLDWGLFKDLLVPFREQKVRMQENRFYIVYIYIDDNTKRIVASAKVDKFLDNKLMNLAVNEVVDILIVQRTDLGFKVIINNLFSGMIYHNEIFNDINIGEHHTGYIKQIRDDGKIDVTLNKPERERVEDLCELILDYLKSNKGEMRLSDSSSPDEIRSTFNCSKKDFKRALGALFKAKTVILNNDGVKLLK